MEPGDSMERNDKKTRDICREKPDLDFLAPWQQFGSTSILNVKEQAVSDNKTKIHFPIRNRNLIGKINK